MAEYNDCVSRAQRLSVARESFLAGDNLSVTSVRVDDLFIYLRWLVTHLTTVRQFHQYLKVIASSVNSTLTGMVHTNSTKCPCCQQCGSVVGWLIDRSVTWVNCGLAKWLNRGGFNTHTSSVELLY